MKTLLIILSLFPLIASAQPNYEKVRSMYKKAEKLGLDGTGTKIAVIDVGAISQGSPGDETWINFDHGYNFIDDNTDVSTTSAHGNFVLTAIKSSEGLAPGATVYVLKSFTDLGNIDTTATQLALQYCIDNDIDIINISQGTVGRFTALDIKIQECLDSGIVIVSASGNSVSEGTTYYPAALPGVIAVNAIDSLGNIYVSNVIAPEEPEGAHGITIAASGRHCYVIGNSNVRVTSSGTSFSSPWIVGMFAIYKQRYPTLSNHEVMQWIIDRAIKQPNVTYFGAGRPTF